ncbi:nitrogen regulation protein NR(II) [Sporomusa aerivorans]|uniref:two-component system sensor histidine kinase NtrB n=1 Tax=Sporomusa aerivorans TaxID=204936 RepID=UPI00352A2D9F
MKRISLLPKSIITRVYLLITIIITVPMIFFSIYWANETKHILLLEKEKQLFTIANLLITRFPDSFDEIIEKHDALHLSDDEKRLLINSILQPIVAEVSAGWPDYYMGYYSCNLGRVALAPTTELFGQKKIAPGVLKAYQSRHPEVFILEDAVTRNGGSVLTIIFPLLDNGEITGHIWVNSNLQEIFILYYRQLSERFLLSLLIWLCLMLLARYFFYQLRISFMQILLSGKENPEQLTQFKVLIPVADAFFSLQKRERELEELKSNLEILVDKKVTELTKTKQQLADVIESISDGFYTLDSNWNFTYANKAFEQMLGIDRENLLGTQPGDYCPPNPAIKEVFSKAMKERLPQQWEGYSQKYNKWIGLTIYPNNADGGLTVYCKDIDQRKKAEQELARLDMLNLIGQIAAGISHEIRNPMTTVKGFLQSMQKKSRNEKEIEIFQLMIDELDRANGIITEFLSAAKIKKTEKKLNTLASILFSIKPLIDANILEEGHNIRYEVEPEQVQLQVDEKEIKQLILNLVRNGVEAMESKGLLTIAIHPGSSGTTLLVSDRGKGIPAEILDKIGTPFFTTKESGTGLGLSTCYGIASRHNAIINCATSPQGTTFSIYFNYPQY